MLLLKLTIDTENAYSFTMTSTTTEADSTKTLIVDKLPYNVELDRTLKFENKTF